MGATIEIAPTAAEQAQEDYDPIPMVALCRLGTILTKHRPAVMVGPGLMDVTFEIDFESVIDSVHIYFSDFVPGSIRPLTRSYYVERPDVVVVHLRG